MKNYLKKIINHFFFIINKGLPDWKKLLKRIDKIESKKNNKKILIATLSGGHKVASTLESMLGVSLKLKGFDVSSLLCDKALDLCIMKSYRANNKKTNIRLNNKLCNSCLQCGKIAYANSRINQINLSNYLKKNDEEKILKILDENNLKLEEILNFKINNINIGEHVRANVCRYYAVNNFYREKDHEEIIKKYFKSALISFYAINNLLEEKKFDIILTNHGFYIPQGILFEIAKSKKINLVTWTSGARKNTFIFSHDKTYNKDFVSENKDTWINLNIKNYENKISDYLSSKVFGSQDYNYHKNSIDLDIESYFEKIKIDKSKPIIGLTTNVIWDAQLHYDDTIFPSMMDWIYETIKFFNKNKDYNLLIRVHPTEIKADRIAREKVKEEVLKNVKDYLSKNIYIVDSNENISTYSLLDKCDAILTYGTKLDIEYAARGFPIVVSGEAITRKKGFVYEPSNKDEYFRLLENLKNVKKLKKEDYDNARKFAFHYFFRRSISFSSILEHPLSFPPFYIKDDFIKEFDTDQNLNLVIDCIINKKPFINKKLSE